MATPACLVTSTPDFSPPKRTAPFLIAATAVPDPRAVIIVDSSQSTQNQFIDFSAHVLSEDAGDKVQFKLYIDYGFPDSPDPDNRLPFRSEVSTIRSLDPSSISDESRPAVQARWFPTSPDPGFGCHTVTLIASHEFDDFTNCPVCKNDSSQITWQAYRCDEAHGHPCTTDFSACQMWNKSCPDATNTAAGQQCGVLP